MLAGLARGDVEVVDPLPLEFSQAVPQIARPSEAMQWLNAHHQLSPITRHALVVLETIDAVDLAFDTFACALLDGEIDTSGYPEYNAVVGGVASHWDEATGDMIVRGVVGWGGRGVRGDTDRIASRILGGLLTNILANQYAIGPHRGRAAGAGRGSRRPRVRPLRVCVGPRARLLLSQVRDAAAPRLTRRRRDADADLRVPVHRVRAPHRHPPRDQRSRARSSARRAAREGTMRKQFAPPTIHFKGSGWAKKDRGAASSTKAAAAAGKSGESGDGSSSSGGRPTPARPTPARRTPRRSGGGSSSESSTSKADASTGASKASGSSKSGGSKSGGSSGRDEG